MGYDDGNLSSLGSRSMGPPSRDNATCTLVSLVMRSTNALRAVVLDPMLQMISLRERIKEDDSSRVFVSSILEADRHLHYPYFRSPTIYTEQGRVVMKANSFSTNCVLYDMLTRAARYCHQIKV